MNIIRKRFYTRREGWLLRHQFSLEPQSLTRLKSLAKFSNKRGQRADDNTFLSRESSAQQSSEETNQTLIKQLESYYKMNVYRVITDVNIVVTKPREASGDQSISCYKHMINDLFRRQRRLTYANKNWKSSPVSLMTVSFMIQLKWFQLFHLQIHYSQNFFQTSSRTQQRHVPHRAREGHIPHRRSDAEAISEQMSS